MPLNLVFISNELYIFHRLIVLSYSLTMFTKCSTNIFIALRQTKKK